MAVRTFEVKGPIRRAHAWATWLAVASALVVGAGLAAAAEGDPLGRIAGGGMVALFVAGLVHQSGLRWARSLRQKTGTLVLGADGLLWRTDEARTFVPWSDVGAVRVDWAAAVVERRGATPLVIRTGGGQKIARVLAEGKAAYTRRVRAEVPSVLDPDSDAEGWLERQRRRGAVDYREGAVEPAVLVRVAEDPSASPLARVGAVLGLPESASAERARVRVALDDVADPDVHEALLAALEDRVAAEQVRALGERVREAR